MKKRALYSVSFFALLLLCVLLAGCKVEEMSTLPDLSKPYAGIYECESITLGGEDLSSRLRDLKLELKSGGEFELSYRDGGDNRERFSGWYEAYPGEEKIVLSAKTGWRTSSVAFPMRAGKIYVQYNFGGKLLNAVFALP